MEIFRISREKYAKQLTPSGCANRWNLDGQKVIYTGSSRSLSTLELIVHRGTVKPGTSYKVLVIFVTDEDHLIRQILINDLPKNWRELKAYPKLQKIGADWYNNQDTLLLKVPSAVLPKEYNYIINAEHPEFTRCVKLAAIENYFWDERLHIHPIPKQS